MLIDKYLSHYHFSEYHRIKINAARADVYDSMLQTEVNKSWIILLLFRLRGMPTKGVISDMEKFGFTKLEEQEGQEIVYGMISTSWIFGQCKYKFLPAEFITDKNPGHIKAAINFHVSEKSNDTCYVSTETRVFCGSNKIKNKFRIYWFVVYPFSRLIRKLMLVQIKKQLHSKSTAMH
jgi:hypothetical protein